jgi:hypothetical protein
VIVLIVVLFLIFILSACLLAGGLFIILFLNRVLLELLGIVDWDLLRVVIILI